VIHLKHLEIKGRIAGLDIGKIRFDVIAIVAFIAIKKIPGNMPRLVCPDCRRRWGEGL
jgi:hypothetical protein